MRFIIRLDLDIPAWEVQGAKENICHWLERWGVPHVLEVQDPEAAPMEQLTLEASR